MFDVNNQWIHLNELYKLMESFFSKFLIHFRIFSRKQKHFQRGVNNDQITMCYISMDSSQQALQTN